MEEVNYVGYQGGKKYDPHSNTGWRDHPSFRLGGKGGQVDPPSSSSYGTPLEDVVKLVAKHLVKFQKDFMTFQQETTKIQQKNLLFHKQIRMGMEHLAD